MRPTFTHFFACLALAGGLGCASLRATAADPTPIPVAMYMDTGVSGKGPHMFEETAAKTPDLKVTRITAKEIRAGKLKDFRVLVMPGGGGSTQGTVLEATGRDAIKAYVKDGGCFVGICAGCYLASTGYDWSLDLLPAKVIDRAHWKRGEGYLLMELTPDGAQWFGRQPDSTLVDCRYSNGPILEPIAGAKEKLITLAHFRQEFIPSGAKPGVMLDSPAIVAARYGKGWAVGISPHPEQTEGLKDLVPATIRRVLTPTPMEAAEKTAKP